MTPSYGFTTRLMRDEYIRAGNIAPSSDVMTLNGHDNHSDTLYFWQLFSILGEDRIVDIITTFYADVLSDNQDTLFRETFKNSGTLEHHVKKQANFWIDVTGGGKRYPGGEARLEVHHDNAKIIMNYKGASRWLHHMKNSIDAAEINDPRVVPCITEFINFFMDKYGKVYDFRARL